MIGVDFSLYLVTGRDQCHKKDLLDVILEAVRGGVTVVQLREKELNTRELVDMARRIKQLLVPFEVPLIINDRADVAVAADADGVHVGQDDMHVLDVRKVVGKNMIVGLTVNSLEQVKEAENLPVDYLGVGPIFPTFTKKTNKPCLYPEGLKDIRQISTKRLVAIGGINLDNVKDVVKTGVDGIAVVSAICSADDPFYASKSLLEKIKSAKC